MLGFGFVFLLVWLICSFVIVINVSQKSIPLGCFTLLVLPIMPFILVWTSYTGNKKVMASWLYFSAIIGFSISMYASDKAQEEMEPFITSVKQELEVDCLFYSYTISTSLREYTLSCNYGASKNFEYKNIDELVSIFKRTVAIKAAKLYSKLDYEKDTSIVLGFHNQSNINVCFSLKPSGEIEKSWYSGSDDFCD